MFEEKPWLGPLIAVIFIAILYFGRQWITKIKLPSGKKWKFADKFTLGVEQRGRLLLFVLILAFIHGLFLLFAWNLYFAAWIVSPLTMLKLYLGVILFLGIIWVWSGKGLLVTIVVVLAALWFFPRLDYANRERELAQLAALPPSTQSVQNVRTVTTEVPAAISWGTRRGPEFDSLPAIIKPRTRSDSILVEVCRCESDGGTQFANRETKEIFYGKIDSDDVGICQINRRIHKDILAHLYGFTDSMTKYNIYTTRGNINFALRLREIQRDAGKSGVEEFSDWYKSRSCWERGVSPQPSQIAVVGEVRNVPVDLPADGSIIGPLDVIDTRIFTYELTAERVVDFEFIDEAGRRLALRESPTANNKTGKVRKFWLRVTDGKPARFRFSRLYL